eukprot:CAMPEP_0114525666 /NCGR_PEP_ID=MMETSP0109-20121206/22560_1 /TAXON_ID=29199 /ORGANISM="Chlorarachnion reptans, Strain CCCM449" /LENGTH=230 /DNA_ID=CAMNT_0001707291 /DNA_START=36 /DNA_END=728 /DNA_ORIENTATION=+
MQIFVSGVSGKTQTLNVSPDESVADVIAREYKGEDVALSFGGRPLVNTKSVSENGIEAGSTLSLSLRLLGGHCQVPCGIFDDPKTVEELKEACATIRKAMVQINELSKSLTPLNFNQMTRWVMTKEEHAKKIISTISEYCLCQRVKPVGAPKSPFKTEKDFVDALKAHHAVMTAAMKAKQSVDVAVAHNLEHAVGDWQKMYLPVEGGANRKRKLGETLTDGDVKMKTAST